MLAACAVLQALSEHLTQPKNVHLLQNLLRNTGHGLPWCVTDATEPPMCYAQEFMPMDFRKQWHGSAGVMPEGTTKITCLPLATLLQMFDLTHIDFFSLDVEGAELAVLQTLDFSTVHINVMVIEQDSHDPQKDEAVRQLLRANGFELDEALNATPAGVRNDWFVNRRFKPFGKPTQHSSQDTIE